MLTREDALVLLTAPGPSPHLVHHALQSEAVMCKVAQHLGEDDTLWALTGLLHDVDFPLTKDTPEQHGLLAVEILAHKLPQNALAAIAAHNSEHTGQVPRHPLDWALRCSESVTGLISANALIRPGGMEGMTPKSLKKKMKDKAFAANVCRDKIQECGQLGLELGNFLQMAITAIAPTAAETGLVRN